MRRCGNCGGEGHNKRTCPYLDKASMKKGGKTNDIQAFREAQAILEKIEELDFFNWAESSNPVLREMEKRVLEIRERLEDVSLRNKLDMMINRENLERFDIGVKIVDGESVSKV